ncbi:MAG TPA: ferredoxin [Mycobacterium sp.]|nr:ferredoxin [Mycobacterium sp.]
MRVLVDASLCQGHGRCYAGAPDLFDPVDDAGHAEVLVERLSRDDTALVDAAERARAECPERAITLEK